ncbi:POK9 protein, partial [Formicarius rufipectus]|nr:POK9 protein [Formicarius rufipectus]
LDLAAAIDMNLMATEPQLIPTGIKGPVLINNQAVGALIIGCSSTSLAGLFILPGLIDADYEGEIKIIAYTPFPALKINANQRIAQLVPLPQLTAQRPPMFNSKRQEKGFGSTGDNVLLTIDLAKRPRLPVQLQWENELCELPALLDTGADTSIIS